MNGIAKACVGLAALAFLGAVAASFMGSIVGLPPESFSRASTNLALIGIGIFVGFKEDGGAGG